MKVLFQQDNAFAHKSAIAGAKIHELRFEFLLLFSYMEIMSIGYS